MNLLPPMWWWGRMYSVISLRVGLTSSEADQAPTNVNYKVSINKPSKHYPIERLRTNCIVGLQIDIDEISGKGTQMFMIATLGTPVRAIKEGKKQNLKTDKSVDGNLIKDNIEVS